MTPDDYHEFEKKMQAERDAIAEQEAIMKQLEKEGKLPPGGQKVQLLSKSMKTLPSQKTSKDGAKL